MSPTPLSKRLQMVPNVQHLILNAPQGYLAQLVDLPPGAVLVKERSAAPEGGFAWLQLFVQTLAELHAAVPAAKQAIRYDGLFWLCYPKKSGGIASDLSRDVIWEEMKQHDLAPVRQISIDDTWSALRFRPPEKVGR